MDEFVRRSDSVTEVRHTVVHQPHATKATIPLVKCSYCVQTFGPWGQTVIEPYGVCERPLHRSLGGTRPRQIVSLFDTINALQGIGIMLAGLAFVTGGAGLRRLCAWVALALFVSASVYVADGAIAWKTKICHLFSMLVVGPGARLAGTAQITFGLCALLLSVTGLAYLT